jgi:hypothetical protein
MSLISSDMISGYIFRKFSYALNSQNLVMRDLFNVLRHLLAIR